MGIIFVDCNKFTCSMVCSFIDTQLPSHHSTCIGKMYNSGQEVKNYS